MNTDVFVPQIARIDAVRDETPDTKTFTLRFREPQEAASFVFFPGSSWSCRCSATGRRHFASPPAHSAGHL